MPLYATQDKDHFFKKYPFRVISNHLNNKYSRRRIDLNWQWGWNNQISSFRRLSARRWIFVVLYATLGMLVYPWKSSVASCVFSHESSCFLTSQTDLIDLNNRGTAGENCARKLSTWELVFIVFTFSGVCRGHNCAMLYQQNGS